MNEAEYKKLNDYLNLVFLELEKKDRFLLDHLSFISNLSINYITILNRYEFQNHGIQNNLSWEDIYWQAREIISSIDREYLQYYDSLINRGELAFFYENNGVSHFCYDEPSHTKLIDINRQFNYEDVVLLVHEFMHYVNFNEKNNHSSLLSEFMSIYFEEYARLFLLENGISTHEMNYNSRLLDTKKTANAFNWYGLLLVTYDRYGSIDENAIEFMNSKYTRVSKQLFDKMCKKALYSFENINKKYNMKILYEKEFNSSELGFYLAQDIKMHYRYLLATLFAYYANRYLYAQDMVLFCKQVMKENDVTSSLEDILKTIGIDLHSKKFQNGLLSSLQLKVTSNKTMR